MTPTFKPNKIAFEKWIINLNEELDLPLKLLASTLSQLHDEEQNATRREQLQIALDLSSRFSALMHNLNLTALEQTKMALLHISKANIAKVLSNIVDSFAHTASDQSKEIHVHYKESDIETYIDLFRLQKILATLLTNALQFSNVENGRVDVSLSITKDRHFKISVQDDGIGIVPEKIAHVFDPLYDADPIHLKLFQTTSAGLYLTWLYANSLGGQLSVESEKDVFTRFTLSLPIIENLDELPYSHYEMVDSSKMLAYKHENNLALMNDFRAQMQKNIKATLVLALSKGDLAGDFDQYFKNDLQLLASADSAIAIARAMHLKPDILLLYDAEYGEISAKQVAHTLKGHDLTKNTPLVWVSDTTSLEIADLNISGKPSNNEVFKKVAEIMDLRLKILNELRSETGNYQVKPKYQNNKEAFLTRLERIVDAHLTRSDFDMDKLSKMLFLNRSQIHRKIKSFTGMNTTEYIRNYKLKMAYRDLENQSGTISEIAYRCGFNSPSYFSKSFKETFGIAPSELIDSQD